jgi:hypothetical protein
MEAVRYDRHAKRRMKEREVADEEVEAAIKNPDYSEPSGKERTNAFKFINGRYLRVTFRKESDTVLVITVTIRKKPFKGE